MAKKVSKAAGGDPMELGTEAYDQRIRNRAYHLWEADGRVDGADLEYWERARELIGMESSPPPGLIDNPVHPGEDRPSTPPPVDEAELEENLGETPGRMTDQGDRLQAPIAKKKRTPK